MPGLFGRLVMPTNHGGPQNWNALWQGVERHPAAFFGPYGKRLFSEVNAAVNKGIAYEREAAGRDCWQLPHETIMRRKGDCEDLAILKMAELAACGIPLDKMFIVICKAFGGHAVLACAHGRDALILDNLADEPYPDTGQAGRLQPINMYGPAGRFLLLELRKRKD